jgi:hypothetical protein
MRLSSAPSVYDAVCKPALQSSLYLMFVTALGTQAERCLVSHRAWTSLSFSAPESLRRAILSLALGVLVLMANVDLFWKSYKDHRTQSARTATATSRTYLKRPKKKCPTPHLPCHHHSRASTFRSPATRTIQSRNPVNPRHCPTCPVTLVGGDTLNVTEQFRIGKDIALQRTGSD